MHRSNEIEEYVSLKKLNGQILKQCAKQNVCQPKILYSDIWSGPTAEPPPNTVFFVQVACTASDDFL